jgi:hypothetical protein
LYVLGGKSTIVSKQTQEQLASTIPNCEIVVMPGIGHYPHLEAPAEYVALIEDFLRRTLRAKAPAGAPRSEAVDAPVEVRAAFSGIWKGAAARFGAIVADTRSSRMPQTSALSVAA